MIISKIFLFTSLIVVARGYFGINKDGTIKMCDTHAPTPSEAGCASDEDCQESCVVPGLKMCISKRFGVLGKDSCESSTPRNSGPPIVQVLQAGINEQISRSPFAINFTSSITLVKAAGKNIIFDTGTISQKPMLVNGLRDLGGLTVSDVDLVFTSHGHPDHFGNVNLFPDAIHHFAGFEIIGNQFNANPLLAGQPGSFLLFDNPDLVVLNTPGHTPQCTSLIVKNALFWNRSGISVGIVGDLFLSEENAVDPSQGTTAEHLSSMKLVLCQVDVIIPGHGRPFFVSELYRSNLNCS